MKYIFKRYFIYSLKLLIFHCWYSKLLLDVSYGYYKIFQQSNQFIHWKFFYLTCWLCKIKWRKIAQHTFFFVTVDNNYTFETTMKIRLWFVYISQKWQKIGDSLKMSKGRVGFFLHKYLSKRKLLSKWVPRFAHFLRRYVTLVESWIHQ